MRPSRRFSRGEGTRLHTWILRFVIRGWGVIYLLQLLLALAIAVCLQRSVLTLILASALPLFLHVVLIVTIWARLQNNPSEAKRGDGWDLRGLLFPMLIVQMGRALLLVEVLSLFTFGPLDHMTSSWGFMLALGANFSYKAPWLSIVPLLAIILAAFGLRTFGIALHEVIDPARAPSIGSIMRTLHRQRTAQNRDHPGEPS